MKKSLLSMVLLLLSMVTSAHDFEVDSIYYNIINENEVAVTFEGPSLNESHVKYSAYVNIPSFVTYNSTIYSVTSIGDYAFYRCSGLTSIIIPNSVTSIGDCAFWGCSGLTSIVIPNSVTSINNAFGGCSGLTSIRVEGGNVIYDSRDNCNAIIETSNNTLTVGCKNTIIPNSVTSIGNCAFWGCRGLTGIVIPNSVTSIGRQAFYDCSGLTSVVIPNSVTSIGASAFSQCSGLTSIDIPNSVLSIGDDAFGCCSSLNSINIPSSVMSIGEWAFSDCTNLVNVIIPNSVTSIGWGAFIRCSSLVSIDIPNSVTILGDEVFEDCTSLVSVSLGDSVTNIGDYMFYGCTSLSDIYIGSSVAYIYDMAFCGCSNLKSITLPKSIVEIKESAFLGCDGLASVNISDLDAWCSISTFHCGGGCADDHRPTVANPLYYAHHLYLNGAEVKDLIIPESVMNIGGYVFNCCTGLTSVVIPNSVTSIGWGSFYDCTGLTSITIPNSVTEIGLDAFYGCNGVEKVEIGKSVSSIGSLAFFDCDKVTDIYCYTTIPPVCADPMTCADDNYTFSNYLATLHVPAASLAAYFTAPVWCNFENIVGDAVAPTGINVSKDSVEMALDNQLQLNAAVSPDNASNKEVFWFSTDTTVATVDNGLVLAVGYGECDIIATRFGMQDTCHVLVANRIALDQHEAMLLPNHILTLTPTASEVPDSYTVSSSDPTVAAARVLSSGKIQVVGIKEGTTTITVGSVDGTAIPATCLVTVYTEPGDMNSDGFVNISDVTSLIDYLLNDDSSQLSTKNADVNGDGHINISDVTALIDALLQNNE